jgi:excisionase family DNA binding protein
MQIRFRKGNVAMKQLYDVISAARLLSISPWTVRSYIHNGKLKPVRLGRRVLLGEDELQRLITESQEQMNALPPQNERNGAKQ